MSARGVACEGNADRVWWGPWCPGTCRGAADWCMGPGWEHAGGPRCACGAPIDAREMLCSQCELAWRGLL